MFAAARTGRYGRELCGSETQGSDTEFCRNDDAKVGVEIADKRPFNPSVIPLTNDASTT